MNETKPGYIFSKWPKHTKLMNVQTEQSLERFKRLVPSRKVKNKIIFAILAPLTQPASQVKTKTQSSNDKTNNNLHHTNKR